MQILEHILKIRREKAKHEFSQTVGNQLATIWHCEIWFANFALRISHCENSVATKHYSFVSQKRQNPLRNFALRISQCGLRIFALRNLQCGFSHCEIRCGFSHCEIRNTLRTVCELIAKIPTVLPSDFVLRITFSSELRFRRFWYRWKA